MYGIWSTLECWSHCATIWPTPTNLENEPEQLFIRFVRIKNYIRDSHFQITYIPSPANMNSCLKKTRRVPASGHHRVPRTRVDSQSCLQLSNPYRFYRIAWKISWWSTAQCGGFRRCGWKTHKTTARVFGLRITNVIIDNNTVIKIIIITPNSYHEESLRNLENISGGEQGRESKSARCLHDIIHRLFPTGTSCALGHKVRG